MLGIGRLLHYTFYFKLYGVDGSRAAAAACIHHSRRIPDSCTCSDAWRKRRAPSTQIRIEANVEDRKYGMLQCSQVDATGGVSGKPPRFTLSVHDMLFVIVLSTCCASTHSCALTTMSPSPGKSPIDAPVSKASPMWPGGTAKPAGSRPTEAVRS